MFAQRNTKRNQGGVKLLIRNSLKTESTNQEKSLRILTWWMKHFPLLEKQNPRVQIIKVI